MVWVFTTGVPTRLAMHVVSHYILKEIGKETQNDAV